MEIHTTRTIDFNGLSRILVEKSYSQVCVDRYGKVWKGVDCHR